MAFNTSATLRCKARSLMQGTPQGTFLLLSRLRYPYPFDRRCFVSLPMNRRQRLLKPLFEAFLRLFHCQPINTGGCPMRNLIQIRTQVSRCYVMSQTGELKLWIAPGFRCYPFQSCCHGWFTFSLCRRPQLPLMWSPCFPEKARIPPAASPCGGLSPPRSTISWSDFLSIVEPSSLSGLSGSTGLRLNTQDLPCSRTIT